MAKDVTGELLRQNYELQLKLNEFYRQINQNGGYPFSFEQLMFHLQKGVEGQFFEMMAIHPDYKPIKKGIVIESQKRNRQEILNDVTQYVLGDNFKNKILAKCKNGKTDAEILREDELLKGKTDKEIKEEMRISGEISADQITERIVQLGKIKKWIIIGYCNGLVVYAHPYDDGRVLVHAYELGAWGDGNRLLSSDKDAKTL